MSTDEHKPGKRSGASLGVVTTAGIQAYRPPPPDRLTAEQAEVWSEIVAAMPADWFGAETHGLLTQYCRHVTASRFIDGLIRKYHEGDQRDLARLNRLSIMQARETGVSIALARSMRLTPQSRIDPKTAGRKMSAQPKVKRPWDTGKDSDND